MKTTAEREIERRWIRRSPKPIKLSGRRHGTDSGYTAGCGCAPCTRAHTEAKVAYNHRRGVLPRGSAEFELRQLTLQKHGTRSRRRAGCDCEPCKEAENSYQRAYRARKRAA